MLIVLVLMPLYSGSRGEQQVLQNSVVPAISGTANEVSVSAPVDEIERDMAKLERLYRQVDKYFYQDVDYNKAYEAMATALFESLGDKYSYYVMAEDKDDYVEAALGTYAGLGLYFSKNYLNYQDPEDPTTLYCVVNRTFPNTPCSRAGLRSDDLIIKIDDVDVTPLEAQECSDMMRGEVGTKVKLTVLRRDQEFELTLTREYVNVPTVEYTLIDNDTTGYIQITEFTQDTWQKACEAIIHFDDLGLKKIIIDLRSNGGGDIDVTLSIADTFISEGELLCIQFKEGDPDIYSARKQTLVDPDVKVAVLVNGDSASSSEILAGAMKDCHRATIIGTTTFGKGIMQIVTPFDEGYYSLTEASFTTASHNPIHGVGITPDIEVPELVLTEEETDAYVKVYNEGLIARYVDEHPDFTDANIEAFTIAPEYGEIRHEILRILVRSEYINRLPGDQQFVIDPNYDQCLQVAVDFLNGEVR